MSEPLAPPGLAREATGRGLRVALIDTGVNFRHPHVDRPGSAWVVERAGDRLREAPDLLGDQVGHGTATAALLLHLAPAVELISIRVTDARPSTDAGRLARAITLAGRLGAHAVAVPLGTLRDDPTLAQAVARVVSDGHVVVAAAPELAVYPAAYPGVLGVSHRDGVDALFEAGKWWAEGRARPAPGHRRNFHGPSLSVARLAAAFARFAEARAAVGPEAVLGFQKALSVL